MNPVAKKEGLLVENIGEEIVVFDRTHNRAHRLNRTTAVVWLHCDGKHSAAELLQVVRHKLNFESADQQVISMALSQLRKLSLIELDALQHDEQRRFSRRELAQKLAVATAMLPAIFSIVVPAPAQAKSSNVGDSLEDRGKGRDPGGDDRYFGHGDGHSDHGDGKDHDKGHEPPAWNK